MQPLTSLTILPLQRNLSLSACNALHRPFFFNDTATPEIYTLSLHDALPICAEGGAAAAGVGAPVVSRRCSSSTLRSEEHTSELQSRENLVCRLLLEKKK